jgi:plastocyanin domain-containing protein
VKKNWRSFSLRPVRNEKFEEADMNIKSKTAVVAVITAVIGFTISWSILSQHSHAAQPPAPEQYKIVWFTHVGGDPEAELNKLSAEGFRFKVALSDEAVLMTK